jgi:hypothetical protein
MSGQALTILMINDVELTGERVQLLEDCMRGMRNVHGESMSTILDSISAVSNAMSEISQVEINKLVQLRQRARENIVSLGARYIPGADTWDSHSPARALGIQEFKWRDFIKDKNDPEVAAVKSYLDAVDAIVSEKNLKNIKIGSGRGETTLGDRVANDVGTFIERRGRGINKAQDKIFCENVLNGDYTPITETNKSDPFADNKAVRQIKNSIGRDEYYIETVAVAPEAAIEELFREELKDEHNWIGYRESYDTVVAVVGKKNPDGSIMYQEDGVTPKTRVILSSFDPHREGDDVVSVDGLVSDSNFVAIALNQECENRANDYAENTEREIPIAVANEGTKSILDKLREKGLSEQAMQRLKVSTQVRNVKTTVETPEWRVDPNTGKLMTTKDGKVTLEWESVTEIDYSEVQEKA